MNKTIALLMLLFVVANGFGQSTANWKTIYIKDLGLIKMPPTLEVQAGSYKEMNKAFYGSYGLEYAADDLVFQQKGLNNNEDGCRDTYVRVMISTEHGEAGSYGSFRERLNLTPEDVRDLNEMFKEQVKNSLSSNTKVVKWLGGKEAVINGMSCYTYSFQRQLLDNPIVQVSNYLFQHDDKMHTLIISFRPSEAGQWESTLNTMKSTFKIEE